MPGAATALDTRYGRTPARRRRGRITAVVAAAVVLVAAAAWAVWTGVGGATGTLELETAGYTVQGDSATTVRWHVTGRAGTPLVCAIEGRDPSGVVVGLVEVALPASTGPDRTGRTVVRTVRRADTGLIASCRDA